jgi:hypothetical protein
VCYQLIEMAFARYQPVHLVIPFFIRWLGLAAAPVFAILEVAIAKAETSTVSQVPSQAWVLQWSAGYASGMGINSSIRKAEYRSGLERRFTPAFSFAGEVAVVRFEGARNGRDASTWGVTLLPLARWNFLRGESGRLAFEFGIGGAVFSEKFPPGGTSLNGYSAFGLTAEIALSRHFSLIFGVRELHHSNGRGLVPSNPAYDAISGNMGTSFAF